MLTRKREKSLIDKTPESYRFSQWILSVIVHEDNLPYDQIAETENAETGERSEITKETKSRKLPVGPSTGIIVFPIKTVSKEYKESASDFSQKMAQMTQKGTEPSGRRDRERGRTTFLVCHFFRMNIRVCVLFASYVPFCG